MWLEERHPSAWPHLASLSALLGFDSAILDNPPDLPTVESNRNFHGYRDALYTLLSIDAKVIISAILRLRWANCRLIFGYTSQPTHLGHGHGSVFVNAVARSGSLPRSRKKGILTSNGGGAAIQSDPERSRGQR
jgi:hypothetical protein